MPIRGPNVFTIPPGVSFLPTLARALIDGTLVEGFPGTAGPLALADATIYVPTQRAAKALADALLEASGADSLLLPRIAPLGAFEPDDEASFFNVEQDAGSRPGAPPTVGDLARRHVLARLVRAWSGALRGAIVRSGPDGMEVDGSEPPLVASTPSRAYALAADLAALIDDLIIESVDWRKLETLAPEGCDPYWRITLDFLAIAFAQWPKWLEEQGLIDRAARVSLTIAQEVEALAAGAARGPTIVAGSTGANRATAQLIAAIARSPKGAVVLPGLDTALDPVAWEMIGARAGGQELARQELAGHPQALLRRLIGLIGVTREDVTPLGAPPFELAARADFLSEALRPAESTDLWSSRDGALAPLSVYVALESVTILEAESETEEALALAVALRETLEIPGKTAALITPDPAIARRVSAELARWGIAVEDSAGRTLGESEAGALARLVLDAAIERTPLAVQALLTHASVRLGRTCVAFDSARRALELGIFRAAPLRTLDRLDAAFAAARAGAEDKNAHPATRWISPGEREAAEALMRDLDAVLAPLRARSGTSAHEAPLGERLAAHQAALASLIAAPEGEEAAPHGLKPLDALMEEWAGAASEGFPLSLAEYAALFGDALARVRAPAGIHGHPRLAILGLLEARLLRFDRALLAGLDETVWPPAAATDAFLNRQMRAALGLSAPERRIGQTGHDFIAALGAPEVFVSRARKRDGAPTVASRFLQRIDAAAGEGGVAAARRRGELYLRFARALDAAGPPAPIQRPEPKPPVALRPKGLSVTRIETLRRDPYAIYAERILRLARLNAVGRDLDPRDLGNAWHGALEDFLEHHPSGPLPADARGALVAFTRQRFAGQLDDRFFERVSWPNVEKTIDFLIDVEVRRRAAISAIWVERTGAIPIPLANGASFELRARADRIDLLRTGHAALIDYKSGKAPSPKEVTLGLSPQLTLEAAILARGGFEGIEPLKTRDALYLKLGGVGGGKEARAGGKMASIADLAEAHLAALKLMLDQFADPETPYLSRPMPQFASRFGDYDHLARVKEWSAAGGEDEEVA